MKQLTHKSAEQTKFLDFLPVPIFRLELRASLGKQTPMISRVIKNYALKLFFIHILS